MDNNRLTEQRILARGANADQATLMVVLYSLGLWDVLSYTDREAWINRAEILDTTGGRALFSAIKSMGGFA